MMPTTMRIMPTIPAGFTMRMLQRPATANQLDNEHDQRDEEQQMNVSAENMEADKTEKPENQQNNKDSPKHKKPFVCGCCQWFASTLAVALTENCTEDCSPLLAGFLKDGAQVPTALFQLHARRIVVALRELSDHACRAVAQFRARRVQVDHQVAADFPERDHPTGADDIQHDLGGGCMFKADSS